MITYIHVAPKALMDNANDKGKRPAVIVKNQGHIYRCHGVVINDADGKEICRIVQNDDSPLDGGTRVWIETDREIVMEKIETGNLGNL